ncbi:prolipoprotein diacylglyceryl transferase [Mariniblastus fucicola]|uniref:Uncharacterized protein n=1 Tax=Mariniblastus fucicola TaxID=980251 RepID=A0A5B9P8G9_9BACT|nr:hypothetical protein [Mariniblastus fucicola]QEG21160.1 hypothetical protein MFFC18_10140 [Mariniblastus fucicola]
MPEDHTPLIDTENAHSDELRYSAESHSIPAIPAEALASESDADDSALVDRTQQLIDEVNQFLGGGPETDPALTVEDDEEEVDLSDSVATLKNFLNDLKADDSDSTTAAEPIETTDAGETSSLEAELHSVFEQTTATEDEAPAEITAALEHATERESIVPDEPAVESDTDAIADPTVGSETVDVCDSENVADIVSTTSAIGDEPTEHSANSSIDPEPESEQGSGFDLAALESVFEDQITDSSDAEPTVAEPTVAEETVAEETAIAEPAAEALPSESFEENSVEESATEMIAAEQTATGLDLEPGSPEEPSEPDALDAESSAVQSDESSADPVSESTDEADEKNLTQKYLEELRSAFDDDLPESSEPESSEPKSSEPESTESETTVSERVDGLPENDEPEEISVESWLASNVNEVSSLESPANANPETDAALETDSGVVTALQMPAESPVETQRNPAPIQETIPQSNLETQPTLLYEDSDTETLDDSQLSDERLIALEASFAKRLRNLENRLGGMFSSLSNQIEQLAHGGAAVSPQAGAAVANVNPAAHQDQVSDPGKLEQGPVEQAAPAGGEKIEVLKEQLTSKLREAEIELSINRAKLSQQRASIEQMQADLERREAALAAKLEQSKKSITAAEKKTGLMDRWKRHLGE